MPFYLLILNALFLQVLLLDCHWVYTVFEFWFPMHVLVVHEVKYLGRIYQFALFENDPRKAINMYLGLYAKAKRVSSSVNLILLQTPPALKVQ